MQYFLFSDETNLQPSKNSQFFIYGGVFVPADKLSDLHDLVQLARHNHGYRPEDEFKFTSASRPAHVSTKDFREAKREVLQGCAQIGLKFTAYLTLHNIAKSQTVEDLVTWAANTIISKFEDFLAEQDATGVCTIDHLPFKDFDRYLKHKFQVGLVFQDGSIKKTERILLFSQSCVGASHAMSAIDILLGAFRYCVNEREKNIAPREMLPVIVNMMWHYREGNTIYLRERGLILRPKTVTVPQYQSAYDELIAHLKGLLLPDDASGIIA